MSDKSPNQEALKKIWETDGAYQLIPIMADFPAARHPKIVKQLDAQASGAPSELAERLKRMAEATRLILKLVDDLSFVRNIDELVEWHKKSYLCFMPGWTQLARAFVDDYAQSKELEKQERLDNAISIRSELSRLIEVIQSLWEKDLAEQEEVLNREINLYNPSLHLWLKLRGNVEKEEERRSNIYRQSECLIELCKHVKAKNNIVFKKIKGGKVQFSIPSSPAETEVWFLLVSDFNVAFDALVEKLVRGEISFDDSIKAAVKVARKNHNSQLEGPSYIISYYLYHVILCSVPHLVTEAIEQFRTLLDKPDETLKDPRIKATLILRYCLTIVMYWRQLGDQYNRLIDAVTLLRFALSLPTEDLSPRLTRDLRFNLARILENLGLWDKQYYIEAAAEYRVGLSIARVAHEREAIGRALGGLASMLASTEDSKRGRIERHNEIIKTYKEALAYLSSDKEHAVNRAVVLNNLAIYYNECELEDWAVNQERALIFSREAVDIVQNTQDVSPAAMFWFNSLKAGIYLTLGNIYRERSYKSKKDNLNQAIDTYGQGTKIPICYQQTKGLLSLNLGQVYLDLFEIDNRKENLAKATYAFEDAVNLLETDLVHYSIALAARASLVLYDGTPSSEEVKSCLTDVSQAIELLSQSGDSQKLARSELIAGNILVKENTETSLLEARTHFERAYQIHNRFHADSDCIIALRKASNAEIQRYHLTGRQDTVVTANRMLTSAVRHLEKLWSRYQSIEWRRRISLMFNRVYGELVWCRAKLGEDITELRYLSSLSKCREFFHYGMRKVRKGLAESTDREDYLEDLRVRARMVEAERLAISHADDDSISTQAAIDDASEKLNKLLEAHDLMSSAEESTAHDIQVILDKLQSSDPNSVVMDFTICRWGTVVLLRLPNGVDRSVVLPFDSIQLGKLMRNETYKLGWIDTYETYKESLSGSDTEWQNARSAWALRTRELLDDLGSKLFQRIFEEFESDLQGRILFIVPGLLQGLPLHAAKLTDKSASYLYEAVKGLSYVTTLSLLPYEYKKPSSPTKALLILVDSEKDNAKQLIQSPSEVAEVATYLCSLGTKVSILAAMGTEFGASVFSSRGILLPSNIDVIDDRPTRNSIRTRLPSYEYILYSGHAVDAGLNITDESGESDVFGMMEILSIKELKVKPFIHLSACETAHEAHGPNSETSGFAHYFIRIGAGGVLSGFWILNDKVSRCFTNSYIHQLYSGDDPATAYCSALSNARQGVPGLLGALGNEPIFWAPFALFVGV